MRWEQSIRYASVSDIGFRQTQQPRQFCDPNLLRSADVAGTRPFVDGGRRDGADTPSANWQAKSRPTQSAIRSSKLRDLDVVDALRRSLETANATINERGSLNRDFSRMGTTCTSLVLCSQGAVIGHVGDSRAYRIRGDRIDQLTFDHSLHWELMRQGRMRPDDVFMHESRHVITRSLGPEPKVQIDIEGPYPMFPGDVYVLVFGRTNGACPGRGNRHHRPRVASARRLSIARQPREFARRLRQYHRCRGSSGQRGRCGGGGRGAAQPDAGDGLGLAACHVVSCACFRGRRDGHPLSAGFSKGFTSSRLRHLGPSEHSPTGSRRDRAGNREIPTWMARKRRYGSHIERRRPSRALLS